VSQEAPESPQWHWGGAYEITFIGRAYLAKRRDNGQELSADCVDDLHDLIVADYSAEAVAQDRPSKPEEAC
jgi:hypothetical protein